jgi:hypothetical protein
MAKNIIKSESQLAIAVVMSRISVGRGNLTAEPEESDIPTWTELDAK